MSERSSDRISDAPRLRAVPPPAEPSAEDGTDTELVECGCGETVEPTPRGQCPACGRVLPGNRLAVRHGGRAALPLVKLEATPAFREWASDLGGEDSMSAGERAVLRRVVAAEVVCDQALRYIAKSRQAITSKRVQQALATLAAHTSNVYAGARLLGLERRAKQVPSLEEALGDYGTAEGGR